MKFIKSYGLAVLIVLGIGAWMITGTLIQGGRGAGEGERPIVDAIDGEGAPLRTAMESIGVIQPVDEAATAQEEEAEPGEAPQAVRVQTVQAQDLPEIVRLRGRTRAHAIVTARAETSGTVQEVHVRKGEAVEAGQLLCTLDPGTRQVRLATAEAQLAQAQADLENNASLRERGVAPANTARQYEVALLSAQAAYDDALAELERIEIFAEVNGVVQSPLATAGNSLSAGTECATIIQLDPMLFVGEVPEARVGQLEVGTDAMITTVTGVQAPGEVSFISASATEATRTFAVEITVPNSDGIIRDGVTAEALVEVGAVRAHLVPQSVLTLDEDGTMGVRVVEDGVVAFYPVEIVRDTREGSWITGLPETADVITLGQEYVRAGQPVAASRSDGA